MTYPDAPALGYDTVDPRITRTVDRIRARDMQRDAAHDRVLAVRRGRFREVWPHIFSDNYPETMVANFVDVVARDLSASLANLPGLACSAGTMKTDADRRRAQRRNRIGAEYWRQSKLELMMKWGADQYLSYGFLPLRVEADVERKTPVILVEDPKGAYYELDRWLNCRVYFRVWSEDRHELAARYPEYAEQILKDQYGREAPAGSKYECISYTDTVQTVIYLPQCHNMVVAQFEHGMVDEMGKPACPVVIALRPGVERDPRGQFDDALWVQLARTVMVALTLEAGDKAVRAPIAVPGDVTDIPTGPDAIVVTDNPNGFKRLALDVPPAAMALNQELTQEQLQSVGYPDTRFGVGPAGGSTGRGISALEGGYNDQIKLGQDVLGAAIRGATEMCFRMDANEWPNLNRSIAGTLSGESYEFSYVPSKELTGNVRCEVSYGFTSGLSPNSQIVTLLQLRGDEIISRRTFREQLPFDIDSDHEQRQLDVQKLQDAVLEGVAAGNTAIGQMMAQGRPDVALQFLQATTQIMAGRRDGKDLGDLMVQAFQPPAPPPGQPGAPGAPGQPGAPGAPGAAAPGDALDGVNPNGLAMGVAPGQAEMGPGGRPSILDLTAGFSGSGPALGASLRRRIPTG